MDHPPWLLRGFREAVLDSNLIDLPLEGYKFTWRRSREDPDTTKERLDRALATQSWIDVFPRNRLINGVADRSDHSPILLKLYERERRVGGKSFRFENKWLDEPDLEMVVREGWDSSVPGELLERLTYCTNELNSWGKKLREKYRIAVEECRRELEDIREGNGGRRTYKEVQTEMSVHLACEEAFWKQRAKVFWLRDGDANVKFFHAMASARKRRNTLYLLERDDGVKVEDQRGICDIAKSYFNDLFEQKSGDYGPVLNLVQNRISVEDNDALTSRFTTTEFKKALFQMHSDKSPGPDGFNPAFYKRFWDLCGVEIFNASASWLERGYQGWKEHWHMAPTLGVNN